MCVCVQGGLVYVYDYIGRDSEVFDWIPSHVRRGLDAAKIVKLCIVVVSLAVLMRRYQSFLPVIEVSNMI